MDNNTETGSSGGSNEFLSLLGGACVLDVFVVASMHRKLNIISFTLCSGVHTGGQGGAAHLGLLITRITRTWERVSKAELSLVQEVSMWDGVSFNSH